MSNRVENVEKLRALLAQVVEVTQALVEDEVCVTFHLGSEQKTVSLKTQKSFSINAEATINQQL